MQITSGRIAYDLDFELGFDFVTAGITRRPGQEDSNQAPIEQQRMRGGVDQRDAGDAVEEDPSQALAEVLERIGQLGPVAQQLEHLALGEEDPSRE